MVRAAPLARGFFIGVSLKLRQGKSVPKRKAQDVLCAALFIVAALFLSPGSKAAQGSTATNPSVPTHEVTDEFGRTLRIPVNPTRVVSLAPSLTETIYALGAEDRLVGDTDYCDYPPDAQKKPKVGGVVDPSLEKIASLHPDLVLVAKEAGNRLETVRALDSLGIPAYAMEARKVGDIITSTEKIADLLDIPATGKAIGEDLQRHLATLQEKLSGVTPKRVLFVVWIEPLISVGKGTFIADALQKAGAASIVDSSQDWPQISMEEVAHLQPDYLIFASSHTDLGVRDFESLANLPGWRILSAVRERHYAVVSDAVIRPAPRMVSAIEDLARQLHPEAFRDPAAPGKAASLADPAVPGRSEEHAARYEKVGPVASSVELACAR